MAFYEPVLVFIGITKMLQIPAVEEQDFPAMTGFGRAEVKPYDPHGINLEAVCHHPDRS